VWCCLLLVLGADAIDVFCKHEWGNIMIEEIDEMIISAIKDLKQTWRQQMEQIFIAFN
jgi:hypothetical protein